MEVQQKLNLETLEWEKMKSQRASRQLSVMYAVMAGTAPSRWGSLPDGTFSKVRFICAGVQKLVMSKVTFPVLIFGFCLAESPVALFFYLLPRKTQ